MPAPIISGVTLTACTSALAGVALLAVVSAATECRAIAHAAATASAPAHCAEFAVLVRLVAMIRSRADRKLQPMPRNRPALDPGQKGRGVRVWLAGSEAKSGPGPILLRTLSSTQL